MFTAATTKTDNAAGRAPRFHLAFETAEREGLVYAHAARCTALAAVAVWLLVTVPWPRVGFYLDALALFWLFGVIPHALRARRYAVLWKAGFALLDVVLLTVVLLLPNPFAAEDWPIQMKLRFHDFLYYFVYLAGTALSGSALLVLWVGFVSAAGWSIGVAMIVDRPDTVTGVAGENTLAQVLGPTFVNLHLWQNQVVLLLIVTGLLAAGAWRARRHLERLVTAEAARATLNRYFSPGLADRLALEPPEAGQVRRADAAVLFIDVVGFTRFAAARDAETVMEFLRDFHARMGACVFQHAGCLDKYLGDGLMATFGAVASTGRDASNALACAAAMTEAVQRWNAERRRDGEAPVAVGIGVHWGPVVAGTLGEGRRLEYTTVGDVVNVASRLERLTRSHGVTVLASDELVAAARADGAALDGWTALGDVRVPAHGGVVGAWTLARAARSAA